MNKLDKEQREAVRELVRAATELGRLSRTNKELLKSRERRIIEALEEKLGLNTERSEVLNDVK